MLRWITKRTSEFIQNGEKRDLFEGGAWFEFVRGKVSSGGKVFENDRRALRKEQECER